MNWDLHDRRNGDWARQNGRFHIASAFQCWPAPVLLQLGFALEKGKALDGKLRTGTSLFAIARRPA
jgi:hypothetical protein